MICTPVVAILLIRSDVGIWNYDFKFNCSASLTNPDAVHIHTSGIQECSSLSTSIKASPGRISIWTGLLSVAMTFAVQGSTFDDAEYLGLYLFHSL